MQHCVDDNWKLYLKYIITTTHRRRSRSIVSLTIGKRVLRRETRRVIIIIQRRRTIIVFLRDVSAIFHHRLMYTVYYNIASIPKAVIADTRRHLKLSEHGRLFFL